MDLLREMRKVFRDVSLRHKVVENLWRLKTLQGNHMINKDSLQTILLSNVKEPFNSDLNGRLNMQILGVTE